MTTQITQSLSWESVLWGSQALHILDTGLHNVFSFTNGLSIFLWTMYITTQNQFSKIKWSNHENVHFLLSCFLVPVSLLQFLVRGFSRERGWLTLPAAAPSRRSSSHVITSYLCFERLGFEIHFIYRNLNIFYIHATVSGALTMLELLGFAPFLMHLNKRICNRSQAHSITQG